MCGSGRLSSTPSLRVLEGFWCLEFRTDLPKLSKIMLLLLVELCLPSCKILEANDLLE